MDQLKGIQRYGVVRASSLAPAGETAADRRLEEFGDIAAGETFDDEHRTVMDDNQIGEPPFAPILDQDGQGNTDGNDAVGHAGDPEHPDQGRRAIEQAA